MEIEHIAVGSNSEEDADKFFVGLLGLKKIRAKTVSADLVENFFGINREHRFIQYGDDNSNFEIFITDDTTRASDIFTHTCIVIENRDEVIEKGTSMGFKFIRIPRKDGNGYYLFVRDLFNNLYEIKQK
ncbi:MAG: VOC family protein [Promethearchaeota archaeon]|jgi:catechol 2,3-dioxygenase-like lactoylglutathione lyase family enzyme